RCREIGRGGVVLLDDGLSGGVEVEHRGHQGADDIEVVAEAPVELVGVEIGRQLGDRPAERAAISQRLPIGGADVVLAFRGARAGCPGRCARPPTTAAPGQEGEHEQNEKRAPRSARVVHGDSPVVSAGFAPFPRPPALTPVDFPPDTEVRTGTQPGEARSNCSKATGASLTAPFPANLDWTRRGGRRCCAAARSAAPPSSRWPWLSAGAASSASASCRSPACSPSPGSWPASPSTGDTSPSHPPPGGWSRGCSSPPGWPSWRPRPRGRGPADPPGPGRSWRWPAIRSSSWGCFDCLAAASPTGTPISWSRPG